MKKREIFKVEGEKITRLRRHCPKCGDGVFLAEHKNRLSCGSCGYTEFKGGVPEKPQKPVAVKEQPPKPKAEGQPPIEPVASEPEEKAIEEPAGKAEEQH